MQPHLRRVGGCRGLLRGLGLTWHSINKTMLMKCPGSNSRQVFLPAPTGVQSSAPSSSSPALRDSEAFFLFVSQSHIFSAVSPIKPSGHSWISKVLCSSLEKGFVGEGVVRWRDRPSKAAHWASKASSWGCGGGWMAGEDGASWV